MTKIEQALFHDGSAHWVSSFALSAEELRLTLHPSLRANVLTEAVFPKPQIVSMDHSYADSDERDFPWDIIGFDSELLLDRRWRFCLHTDAAEHVFESAWPEIVKGGGA